MREIKFRAWDEKREIMHQEFNFIQSHGDGTNWIIPVKHVSDPDWITDLEGHFHEMPHERQQFKLMQYTGLKDKNGVEIYEGDIVRGDFFDGVWKVFFWEGCFTLKPYAKATMANYNCPRSMEVIGNIYQNRELLK